MKTEMATYFANLAMDRLDHAFRHLKAMPEHLRPILLGSGIDHMFPGRDWELSDAHKVHDPAWVKEQGRLYFHCLKQLRKIADCLGLEIEEPGSSPERGPEIDDALGVIRLSERLAIPDVVRVIVCGIAMRLLNRRGTAEGPTRNIQAWAVAFLLCDAMRLDKSVVCVATGIFRYPDVHETVADSERLILDVALQIFRALPPAPMSLRHLKSAAEKRKKPAST
jgi:hypothetical protein